jgi:glycosyltransferase involved in cell wall biosynthesis
MKPFFAIIIPTLNEEKFVGKLLNDLSHQTYRDFEVIVVDAKSEDGTIETVKQYQAKFPLLKIVKLQKRNVSEQRNKGAMLAKGDYLVFLDADGRIKNHFLFRLRTYIKTHKGLLFLPKLGSIKNDQEMNLAIDFSNAFVAVSTKFGKPFSTGGSMIVEKHFFNHIGGFPEDVSLSEDHLLVQNAYKHGVFAKLLPNISVQFSLRRFTREGKLNIFLKYIKSTIYFLAKGKVDKKIIEYEMGGHLYNKKSKKVFFDLMKINPQKLLKEFNTNIRAFVRGLDL